MHKDKGLGIIISGPSGVGKGTIIKELLLRNTSFQLSTSYCTREAREKEVDGIDYHFISVDAFKEKIKNNEFVEWANVHGNYYGTDTQIINQIKKGKKIIFEIDVQGAKSLINTFNNTNTNYLSFFLSPPSIEELEHRLKNRDTENKKSLRIRLNNAKQELLDSSCFNYTVVNDKIDTTTNEILSIITGITGEKGEINEN